MNYYKTSNGSITSISTVGGFKSIGTHNQVTEFSNLTVKTQEVRNLVKQYSGKKSDWQDDKFILTGIKNILMGK
jgi:hypothetical protein